MCDGYFPIVIKIIEYTDSHWAFGKEYIINTPYELPTNINFKVVRTCYGN